jgi:predicted peptidase
MSNINRRTALMATALLLNASGTQAAPRRMVEGQQAWALHLPGDPVPMRFWLYLPQGYLKSRQRWPLLVFLHGSGERGDDLEAVKRNGPPQRIEQGEHYPCILVSPQLEADADWDPARLHALHAALQQVLRVDSRHISATGLSRGGHGVWDWAAAYPEDLAAIAPVCGYSDPAAVCRARLVPVRAYHGDADTVVPIESQQACVDALRACGGQAEFIIYPGVGHAAWIPAYEDPALLPWLLAQARR